MSGAQVLARVADVLARHDRVGQRDVAVGFLRLLDGHNRVGAGWQRGAGRDADRLAGGK